MRTGWTGSGAKISPQLGVGRRLLGSTRILVIKG